MKWHKKICWQTLLILLPLLLTTAVPTTLATTSVASSEVSGRFTDLGFDHWAHAHVSRMAENGILSGYPDGTFRAGNAVSTGEFIKMAVVASDIGGSNDESLSSASSHWAIPYYDVGRSAELFTGFDIGPLTLDHPITRDKMALIVNALLGDRPMTEERTYGEWLSEMRDVDSRTSYEYSIVRSYAAGILTGYPDGTFRPKGILSRAEAAVVFSKLEDFLSDPPPEARDAVEETKAPEDEKEPFVVIGSVMSSEPPETLTFTMHRYDTFSEATLAELGFLLKQYLPAQSIAMENAFVDFAAKPAGPGRQGIRKQYFGELPVLMERVNKTLRIFVFPAGYSNRTWDTLPGQVNEAFF
jgi:hypothetical protein